MLFQTTVDRLVNAGILVPEVTREDGEGFASYTVASGFMLKDEYGTTLSYVQEVYTDDGWNDYGDVERTLLIGEDRRTNTVSNNGKIKVRVFTERQSPDLHW